MKEFFSSTLGKVLSIVLGIVLVVGIGYGFYKLYNQSVAASEALKDANLKIAQLTKQNGDLAIELAKAKKDYMEMNSKSTTKTIVQYVEKKTPNDADVEVTHKIPKVVVNAGDGKSYDFTPDSKSAQNIVDGKVVLTEDNTLHLDIEKIVDARFKDKVDAINAKHTTELKEKDAQVADLTKKLKRTRKQRDFYVGATIIGTGVGMYVGHRF